MMPKNGRTKSVISSFCCRESYFRPASPIMMMQLAQRLSDKFDDRRLRINVGGVIFETMRSTLRKRPATRLALLADRLESDETWDVERKEYFFDRHPGVFSSILHCYRTDELHTEHNLCGNIIKNVSGLLVGRHND